MRKRIFLLCLSLLLCGVAQAASRTGGVVVVSADGLDGGGQRTTGALYRVDGSLGGIGGVSLGNGSVAKAGYIGQLTDVTNLTPTVSPAPMNEADTAQLSGMAGMDDGTVAALSGNEVRWAPVAFPLTALAPNGVATSGVVYADTAGAITGAYLGVTGTATFVVLDVNPDNYGLYAGDQVSDGWQVRYYGVNNPSGQGGATASNGQRVADNYVADLDPTDPSARFVLTAFSNGTPARVYFSPSSNGRVYSLYYRASLNTDSWCAVAGQERIPGGTPFLNDTNALSTTRFYRVDVSLP